MPPLLHLPLLLLLLIEANFSGCSWDFFFGAGDL